jgi:hypothetical protein
MFGAAASLGDERHDIRERLPRLRDKISALESLLGIPADLTGEKDHAAFGDNGIAKAFGRLPPAWMKECMRFHLISPHEAQYFCLRMILSDLASPAVATSETSRHRDGFAQAGNRFPPSIESKRMLFGIMR